MAESFVRACRRSVLARARGRHRAPVGSRRDLVRLPSRLASARLSLAALALTSVVSLARARARVLSRARFARLGGARTPHIGGGAVRGDDARGAATCSSRLRSALPGMRSFLGQTVTALSHALGVRARTPPQTRHPDSRVRLANRRDRPRVALLCDDTMTASRCHDATPGAPAALRAARRAGRADGRRLPAARRGALGITWRIIITSRNNEQ